MRPTDENQPSSTRPPFMSATRRPTSTEDNILARMERDSRRGGGSSWKRSWIAWSSVASLAIIGLIGVLASLARENMEVHQPALLAESKPAPDLYGAQPLMAGTDNGFAPLPPPAAVAAPVPPKPPAAAVEARPARTPARADEVARPKMVMLKPPPARAVAAKPPASAPHKSAPVVAVAAKPAPARAPVASVPRPKKPLQAPAPTLEPAVDSDVALLSAIIMHASRHAGERAQLEAARCGAGKKCAPAAADPLTSLKATD